MFRRSSLIAIPAIGTPAVFQSFDGKAIIAYLPPGLPDAVTLAVLRYELAKAAWTAGDGSLVSELTGPIRWLDGVLHGPVSEILSWLAVLFPPKPKPEGDPPHVASR